MELVNQKFIASYKYHFCDTIQHLHCPFFQTIISWSLFNIPLELVLPNCEYIPLTCFPPSPQSCPSLCPTHWKLMVPNPGSWNCCRAVGELQRFHSSLPGWCLWLLPGELLGVLGGISPQSSCRVVPLPHGLLSYFSHMCSPVPVDCGQACSTIEIEYILHLRDFILQMDGFTSLF